MAKRWDADEIAKKLQFNVPTYLVYFIAGITIARFQAYAVRFIDWLQPFMYGVYAIWGLLALLCCLSCYMNKLKGEPPIQQGEALTIALLLGLLIVAAIGFSLEDLRLEG
ncbi:MAG TPA: hypothetical protein V6C65_16795 [Allocoleopsis sp.]